MKEELNCLLENLSNARKSDGIRLDNELWDATHDFLEDNLRYSTRIGFKNSPFWKILSPKLQQELVKTMLQKQIKRMKYFFYDFERDGRFGAPDDFVMSIMVSLDSTLYSVGTNIISSGQRIDQVYFIIQGCCSLSGLHLRKDTKETMRFELVKLDEGSWYGDYQVLMNTSSNWEMDVCSASKRNVNRIASDKALIFDIDSNKFMKICNRYPEFRRYILTRANLRRAYFTKVYLENRHELLL